MQTVLSSFMAEQYATTCAQQILLIHWSVDKHRVCFHLHLEECYDVYHMQVFIGKYCLQFSNVLLNYIQLSFAKSSSPYQHWISQKFPNFVFLCWVTQSSIHCLWETSSLKLHFQLNSIFIKRNSAGDCASSSHNTKHIRGSFPKNW